jgi:MIP family channel proteins
MVRPYSDASRSGATGDAEEREPPIARRLYAEVLGTGFLTFVAAGVEIAAVRSHGEVDLVARSFAPGFVVMAMIYAMGDVSGAHFNPAVSLAFALRRVFDWRQVPLYWAAQILGAVAAATLLRVLFGRVAHVGASQMHTTVAKGVVIEVMLTWLLITIVLNTATRHQVIGAEAAIAVGATIVVCGLFGGPLTGPSMNPARSLGPAIVSGTFRNQWVYVVAPAMGCVVAAISTWILHPHRNVEEVEAAGGER